MKRPTFCGHQNVFWSILEHRKIDRNAWNVNESCIETRCFRPEFFIIRSPRTVSSGQRRPIASTHCRREVRALQSAIWAALSKPTSLGLFEASPLILFDSENTKSTLTLQDQETTWFFFKVFVHTPWFPPIYIIRIVGGGCRFEKNVQFCFENGMLT